MKKEERKREGGGGGGEREDTYIDIHRGRKEKKGVRVRGRGGLFTAWLKT